MVTEAKVLDVKGGEEGELSYQGMSYYLRDHLWLHCLDLQVSRTWDANPAQLTDKPAFRTNLSGTAKLHPKLSIIGDPRHPIDTVLLRIDEGDEGDVEAGLKRREITAATPGLATLGLYPADKDHELKDTWWVVCELSSDCFKSLVEAVEARRLTYLHFRLSLKDLYSDNDHMVASKNDRVRFLRPPDAEKGSTSRPQNAWGHVTELDFGLEKVEISIAKSEPETATAEVPAPPSPPQAPSALVSSLNEAIRTLRARMALCVGIIVALVAFIAFTRIGN